MFIVRFTTISKAVQNYYYHRIEDADKHLQLFLDDNSGLYRNISILDEKSNTVLGILPFKDGKPQKIIVHGSIVKIKPEWCSPGEEKYIFRVSNIHEQLEHACITCLNSILTIKPSEIVGIDMIFPAQEEECNQERSNIP